MKEREYKILNWSEYCQEIFDATAEQVERALRNSSTSEESIENYRKSEYILLDRVVDPDMNSGAVRQMYKEIEKMKLPKGFKVALEESYYDRPGTLVQVAVGIKRVGGEALLPQSLDFG